MIDTRDPNPEQFPERIWLLRTMPTDPNGAGEVYSRWLDAPIENTRRYECREYRPVRVRVVVPVKRKFTTPQHITVGQTYWECPNCCETVCLMRGTAKYCQSCGLELDWSGVTP